MERQKEAENLVFQGVDFARKGKHLKAVEAFLGALEIVPGNGIICFNLALEYLSMDEPELAFSYLDRAVEQDPDNPDYWCERGIAQYRILDYAGAEESYERAMSCGGETSRLWNNFGVLRFITERYQEAEEFFDRAVKLDPLNADAWYNLADTLDELGNPKGAETARREFEKLDRKDNS